MFNISDKVVCVDDSCCVTCGAKVSIIKNQVYVINDRHINPLNGILLVNLTGVTLNCHETPYKRGFAASRFRKLEEVKAANLNRQYSHKL
jgi:hypothetical protein